ncbi:M42 family metallopeptidase [Halorarius halobius]|uniref:M42 family metallopeptidase n=1 Tax=Halorarius halobius TaxID=2962671 RepID=UPI0020CBCC19|nr:M20/M25/M40 family metallo-hydrolase [Halorarius halobius]
MHGDDLPFDYELLVELTETSGVPGYEDRVREVVRRELAPEVDRLRSDAMGNVVGTVDGGDTEVLVAAHMDEIGFMVSHVDDGFLGLEPLGGWDPRVLKAQRVTVHAEDGDLPGVIGSPPVHTLDDEDLDASEEVADVRVDLGLPATEVDERVAVGDLVTTDQRTERVGEHVTGKSLDNRVSVLALVEAARALTDPEVTVHFAATAQEEVGLRGAMALGVDVDADVVLALDTTVANDVPGVESGEHVTRLGEGAGIKLKDSSSITNPKLNRRLRMVADERSIPHQPEILPTGGTDTGGLQFRGGAKPAGAISVPTRYLHTPTEAVHHDDVRACLDLAVAFLETESGGSDYTL